MKKKNFTLTWQYFRSTWSATSRSEWAISLHVNLISWLTWVISSHRLWQSLTISGKFDVELCTKCGEEECNFWFVLIVMVVV